MTQLQKEYKQYHNGFNDLLAFIQGGFIVMVLGRIIFYWIEKI